MTFIIYAAAFFAFGVGVGMMLATVVNYAWSLRRQLKDAQKALQARDAPAPQPYYGNLKRPEDAQHVDSSATPRDEPRFSGIGPTDIYSRELYERQQAERESTPPFASPKTLNPDLKDIREAAHEATAGNRVN